MDNLNLVSAEIVKLHCSQRYKHNWHWFIIL